MKFFTSLTIDANIPDAAFVATTEQVVPALAIRMFRRSEHWALGVESA
jgi:hypothetical protein